MKSQPVDRRDKSRGESSPRRPYLTPILNRLGTVDQLTLSAGTSPHADPIVPGLQTKASP